MIEKISPKLIFSDPIHLLAFGFGSGLSPKAPGTLGTLAVIPIYLLLQPLPLTIYLAVLVGFIVSGVYICGQSAKRLGVHDHGGIVWDEFCGFLLTMTGFVLSWQNLILGFVFFRLFDILKPWPISWLDKNVDGGWGIMIDDVIAGIFAWFCLYGVNQI